jgi:HipA-like protein
MLSKIKKWFSKGDEDYAMHLPKDAKAHFILKIEDVEVGHLNCLDGIWEFKYTEEFKSKSNQYKPIIGFPNLNETYKDETLWPFFRLRIPGLKQPSIQEILKEEKIDQENEVELLKRFGKWTISNPYSLMAV